ncbi:hypothetical protein [Zavarzinella formosa]|uniref:hypothetical protein n=1 Tax=Zavarzinella formosa TaxID=360055 RepID=UPI000380E7AB|nr:hypothetical protein [Zavarzinella formosa]
MLNQMTSTPGGYACPQNLRDGVVLTDDENYRYNAFKESSDFSDDFGNDFHLIRTCFARLLKSPKSLLRGCHSSDELSRIGLI